MACDSPKLIKNPYYNKDPSKGLNFLHDCKSYYMRIPCGYCPSCIATKQMYMLQRFYMESLNSYVYFSTFTYDNEHLPILEVNDYSFRYADFKHFTDMVKRIRVDNLFERSFSYFAVSELGTTRGRPHFHCLWFLPKYESDTAYTPLFLEELLYHVLFNQWKVRVSISTKKPVYEPLFTFHQSFRHGKLYSNFDLHYVKPLLGTLTSESVAFYVMKYLLKSSDRERRLQQALKLNLSGEDYNNVWRIIHSHSQFSKHFGYGINLDDSSKPLPEVLKYVKDGISRTPKGSPYPCFFSPLDGTSYPLAPYYQSRSVFYSLDDALPILMNSTADIITSLDDDFYQKANVHFQKFQKILRESDLHGNPILFD